MYNVLIQGRTCGQHLVFLYNLKDVESFKLDVATVVSQQVHHQFQVFGPTDVLCHDGEVVSIQKKLPE